MWSSVKINLITQLLTKADAVVLGPGIGLDPETEKVIPKIASITAKMSDALPKVLKQYDRFAG